MKAVQKARARQQLHESISNLSRKISKVERELRCMDPSCHNYESVARQHSQLVSKRTKLMRGLKNG